MRSTGQFRQVGVREKMTEMRSKLCRAIAFWLCICIIISLKPVVIPFEIAAVGSGLIFQDDNAWPELWRTFMKEK